MNAAGTCRKRDVGALVQRHEAAMRPDSLYDLAREGQKLTIRELAFANLDHGGASSSRAFEARQQCDALGTVRGATCTCDDTDDGTLGEHASGTAPHAERTGELREPCRYRDDADPRHGAADERVRRPPANQRALGEEVLVPEGGPRGDHQDQPRLDEIGSEDEAGENRNGQPSVSTLASRATRAVTSR